MVNSPLRPVCRNFKKIAFTNARKWKINVGAREMLDETDGPNMIGHSLCFVPATNAGSQQKSVLLPGCRDVKG